MAWNNKKIKRLFDREKKIATSRHNIAPEWLDNLTIDDVTLFDGNQKALAYIRGILRGIQMVDNGFAPVTPAKIEKVSSLTLSKLENKGNVCRFYFCGENREETFFDFSFDFKDFFVSTDELDDIYYGKVDNNHWPAGFVIPASVVESVGCFDAYTAGKYLYAKEAKAFYLGMSYEDFFEIINTFKPATNIIPEEIKMLEVIDYELRGNQVVFKLGHLADEPWGDDWNDHSCCPDPVYEEYVKGVLSLSLPFDYSVYDCNYDYCGYVNAYSKKNLIDKVAPCLSISMEEVYSFQQASSLKNSTKIFFGDTIESIERRLAL